MTLEFLDSIKESDRLPTHVKEVIRILIAAINDWPTAIYSLDNYGISIFEKLGFEADKNILVEYLSKIDYSTESWEAESLYQLCEIYNFYDSQKKLHVVFEEVKQQISLNLKTN